MFTIVMAGVAQILAWGSSYYLLAVLSEPISLDMGWSKAAVVGGFSVALAAASATSLILGRLFDQLGGRSVLALSSLLFSSGLALVAVAHEYPLFLTAWVLIGFGMGVGLFEAMFAALARLPRINTRKAMTMVALFGGMASGTSWLLSAYLLELYGWRGVCLLYAGLHLAFGLPLYLRILPKEANSVAWPRPERESRPRSSYILDRRIVMLLAVGAGLGSMVTSFISVHVITVLQSAYDMDFTDAVALSLLISPAQVGIRLLEMFVGRFLHPIWTMFSSTLLYFTGCVLMAVQSPLIAIALVSYGAGLGLRSIARGTLPHALTDGRGYALLVGRLATISLCVQACVPWVAAFLMESIGIVETLYFLVAITTLNIGADILLVYVLPQSKSA